MVIKEECQLKLELLRILKLKVQQHNRMADQETEECKQYKGSFDEDVPIIGHLHLNRKQLLEEIDRFHDSLDKLEQKIDKLKDNSAKN